MRDMAAATPGGFEILATVEGGSSVEKAIHRSLADHLISGEWFHDHPDVWAAMDAAKSGAFVVDNGGAKDAVRLPIAEDAVSDNIVLATRFYLNELVKREWRGMGDTIELARDRVMRRNNLSTAYGSRLWNRSNEFNDVAGEVYRCLWLNYSEAAEADGSLCDELAGRLASYRKYTAPLTAKGMGTDTPRRRAGDQKEER